MRATSKEFAPPASLSLGKLALADGALPEDVVAMLPCLTSSKDPADQKALDNLQSTGPTAVREALRAR